MTRRNFVPALCHPERMHDARGLCSSCWTIHRRHGTHVDFPRVTRSSEELVEDAERLRARYPNQPMTWPEIAAELGVTYKALDKARERVARTVRSGVQ